MTCDLCGKDDCTWVHGEWCQGRAEVLAGTREMKAHEDLVQMAMARTALLRDAVEFAHSEGFEWPTDPFRLKRKDTP